MPDEEQKSSSDASPGAADGEAEQARPLRRRVLKSGLICFNARHSTLPCTVRDLTDRGAKLIATGSIGVPDTFELHIELVGLWVGCEVVWRRADAVGVVFTSPIVTEAPKRKQVLTAQETGKPSLRRVPKRP